MMEDSQARAILREHGETPPVRGKLGAEWLEKAEGYRDGYIGDLPGDPPLPPPEDPPEDAAPSPNGDAAPEPEDRPAAPEERPRRPRAPRGGAATAARGWRERFWGKQKATRGRPRASQPRKPRRSVDKLCATAWRGMAGAMGYLDEPVSKVLQLQAPVAGLILEDTVRGTFLDIVLQPLAEMQETASRLGALIGPPVLVALIEACQGLPETQRNLRLAILFPMLEASLMSWYHVAGDRAEEISRRAAEDGPAREAAHAWIAMIFASRQRQPEPEDTRAEQAQSHADDNVMAGVFA